MWLMETVPRMYTTCHSEVASASPRLCHGLIQYTSSYTLRPVMKQSTRDSRDHSLQAQCSKACDMEDDELASEA